MTHQDTVETLKDTAEHPRMRASCGALSVPPDTLRVSEGTEAWKRIKQRARMDREDWKLVGEALLIGRRDNPSNQAFGQWCRENGFGDMRQEDRTAAVWWARHHAEVIQTLCLDTLPGHPRRIREAFNEVTKGGGKPSTPFTTADAEYAQKLHAMATRGAEHEAEVAKGKLESFAKGFGMSAEEVVGRAEEVCPDGGLSETEQKRREAEAKAEAARAELARRDRILEELKGRFQSATKDELITILADLKARGIWKE